MKKVFRLVYWVYAGLVISLGFILLLPFFELLIRFPKIGYSAADINRLWARFTFPMWFLPVEIEDRGGLHVKDPAILAPNHFSYLDIALMSFARQNYKYVGKKEIENVPLFGRMFSRLHITVNRKNKKEAAKVYGKVKQAVDDGFSVIMFPEGGIRSKNMPQMHPFKDGAFKISIEKNIPLVPVTIVNTWNVLDAAGTPDFRWFPLKLIFHEPIDTSNYEEEDFEKLKEKTFKILQDELNIQCTHGNK